MSNEQSILNRWITPNWKANRFQDRAPAPHAEADQDPADGPASPNALLGKATHVAPMAPDPSDLDGRTSP